MLCLITVKRAILFLNPLKRLDNTLFVSNTRNYSKVNSASENETVEEKILKLKKFIASEIVDVGRGLGETIITLQ